MNEWNTVDLSPFDHVALYGSNPVDDASKDDYFESLFYSSAVVGLNTSAFLEGAVVGKPAHTILLPEFHENQEGTLHFRYLFTVGGGVLQGGRTFDEHHAQLAASLRRPADQSGAGYQFVRDFIRPNGLETPATPVFCDVVDDMLRVPAPAPEPTPIRFTLLRWVMYPTFLVLRRIYGSDVCRDDWNRKEREHQKRREERDRQRRARQQAAADARIERDRRRAETLAARQTAADAALAERNRVEGEKTRREQIKEREKSARLRQRDRAAMRARIKQGAHRWLSRCWPGRQTT